MARTPANPGDHDAAGTISVEVAAKLLMVTPEWIRRLSKDGWIPELDRGRYRVVDVVQGYIRFLKDEARRSTKTASHTRLRDIRTRKEELNVAQTERELVPLADAMTLVDEVAGAVVARVNAIPARFTRDIEQRALLQREVDDALADTRRPASSSSAAESSRPTRKAPPSFSMRSATSYLAAEREPSVAHHDFDRVLWHGGVPIEDVGSPLRNFVIRGLFGSTEGARPIRRQSRVHF